MSIRKRVFFFVQMMLLVGCILYLTNNSTLRQAVSVFYSGVGQIQWRAVGYGAQGDAMAAAWMDNGTLSLQPFRVDETRSERWNVVLPEQYRWGTISSICPVRENVAMLGIYSLNGDSLAVFRLSRGSEAECLIQSDCEGVVSAERSQNMRLTRFYQENGRVYFGFYGRGEIRGFSCAENYGAVEALGSETYDTDAVASAVVMSDGRWALGDERGNLDVSSANIEGVGIAQFLTRGRVGWYYLDAASMEVRFVDPGTGMIQSLFSIENYTDSSTLMDLALTDGEGALLLLDGNYLVYTNSDGPTLFSGILKPSLMSSAMKLAAFLLLCLAIAAILTYILCAGQGGYTSLAVYYGSTLIVLSLVCGIVIRDRVLLPVVYDLVQSGNGQFIQGVVRTVLEEESEADARRGYFICRQLENAEGGYQNVRLITAKKEDGKWVLRNGALAVSSPIFNNEMASQVFETQENKTLRIDTIFYYCEPRDGGVLMVRAEDKTQSNESYSEGSEIATVLLTLPITLAAIAIFLMLVHRTHRLTRQMELITQSRATGENRLVMRTGDEFESMASSTNSLAEWLEKAKEKKREMENAYRRFVPEKVLALLGGKSILEVSKDTFSVRRMTVMRVGFEFPERFYTDQENARLLFESVNEVIACTASIVSQKGGTVFNYSYDGYTVVMELDGARAVSAAVAVQQQILSFNEKRAAERLPAVSFNIAIDVGDVVLGVVGDDTRLETTGISPCFSVVQELLGLCKRLDAKILCTELVMSGAEQYGNRYVGKCKVGTLPVRVYEIFEGDDYSLRRAKASQAGEFSKAVLELYSGDTALAKKVFLRLAHNTPEDGCARYYLYLSDQLERNPRQECSLNESVENRERK